MRLPVLVLLSVALFALAGCAGYTVGPVKPTTMREVTKLAVQSFRNDTLEPRLEMLLTNTLIKQLQQDGTYQIVDEKEADAILQGTLTELERRQARSVTGNALLAREYTVTLRAHYVVVKRDGGQTLDSRSITGTTSFFVSGSSALKADVNQDERQAIPIATEDLAVRLVSAISEGW